MLQCLVVCCSVLECVGVCYGVLQCVASYLWLCCDDVLQYAVLFLSASVADMQKLVAVCCNVLQCVAMCCNVLQCAAVCCNQLQCVADCCANCAELALQCVAVTWHLVAVCCSVSQ